MKKAQEYTVLIPDLFGSYKFIDSSTDDVKKLSHFKSQRIFSCKTKMFIGELSVFLLKLTKTTNCFHYSYKKSFYFVMDFCSKPF